MFRRSDKKEYSISPVSPPPPPSSIFPPPAQSSVQLSVGLAKQTQMKLKNSNQQTTANNKKRVFRHVRLSPPHDSYLPHKAPYCFSFKSYFPPPPPYSVSFRSDALFRRSRRRMCTLLLFGCRVSSQPSPSPSSMQGSSSSSALPTLLALFACSMSYPTVLLPYPSCSSHEFCLPPLPPRPLSIRRTSVPHFVFHPFHN